jgi:geranylgeranyl pyrophosphate synthase
MRIGGPLREEERLTITAQKTGALTSACCRVGALLGRADPRQLEGLTRYGLHIGIALQLDKSRRLLGRSDGIECACERALSHAQSAKEALRPFKDCGDKRILMAIADMVVECLIPPPGPRCTGTEPEAWCSSSRQ